MKYIFLFFFVVITSPLRSQDLYFPPTSGDEWDRLELEEVGWCEENLPDLLSFLEESDTKSFIVLKDGKIVIEEYFNGHGQDSVWYWASAAKSLTAFEIGILQENGDLDVNDSTSDYLNVGWTNCDADQEEQISVKNQLSMTTGLDFTTVDLDCTLPECLTCLNAPGAEWYYDNAPYTLLGDVIENVSGQNRTLHTFFAIGQKTGLTGAWVPVGYNRVFFSKSRSMARFGLLMNGHGKWDDEVILADDDYFTDMISPSQDINPAYGYLWWLNSGPDYRLPGSTLTFQGKLLEDAPDHLYMALGKNSQVLLVDTVENIVVVRMGDDPDEALVPTVFMNEFWDKLSDIICTTSTLENPNTEDITISPNPANDIVEINSELSVNRVALYDITGQNIPLDLNEGFIDISHLQKGLYFIRLYTESGSVTKRFIKD